VTQLLWSRIHALTHVQIAIVSRLSASRVVCSRNGDPISEWSSGMSIDSIGSSVPVSMLALGDEAHSGVRGRRRFELSLTLSAAAGRFRRTVCVSFAPRYVLVNKLPLSIHLKQFHPLFVKEHFNPTALQDMMSDKAKHRAAQAKARAALAALSSGQQAAAGGQTATNGGGAGGTINGSPRVTHVHSPGAGLSAPVPSPSPSPGPVLSPLTGSSSLTTPGGQHRMESRAAQGTSLVIPGGGGISALHWPFGEEQTLLSFRMISRERDDSVRTLSHSTLPPWCLAPTHAHIYTAAVARTACSHEHRC
jgi:hypothetical protein